MKTTKVFIGLFLVLAVASLFLSEWLFFGYALATLIISILLLIEEKKNAQLTSNLADAEKKVEEWKNKHATQLSAVWGLSDIIINLQSESERLDGTIFDLTQSLQQRTESAQKLEAYLEKERARSKEKYERLYKGKKKAVATEQKNEQPYQIEGKTIKQLVEENLGIEVDLQFGSPVFLCGYDKEFANSDINANWSPFLVGNNTTIHRHRSNDDVVLKQFSNILWRNTTDVINAIKKHRNIQ